MSAAASGAREPIWRQARRETMIPPGPVTNHGKSAAAARSAAVSCQFGHGQSYHAPSVPHPESGIQPAVRATPARYDVNVQFLLIQQQQTYVHVVALAVGQATGMSCRSCEPDQS
jgi:hypothetical protein